MTLPRVLVVRSGIAPFAVAAGGLGIEVVERVSHTIEPVEVADRDVPDGVDLAVFSSRIAVDRALGDIGSALARSVASAPRVFAVGRSTGAALRERGIARPSSGGGSAESLLASLPERLDGSTALFVCGADALASLPEGLRARGARVVSIAVYRKVANPFDPSLERAIREAPFGAFCATAPSAAQWLFEGLGPAGHERLGATPAVVLGMSTLRWLAARGVERIEVASKPTFRAAARALEALATGPPEK